MADSMRFRSPMGYQGERPWESFELRPFRRGPNGSNSGLQDDDDSDKSRGKRISNPDGFGALLDTFRQMPSRRGGVQTDYLSRSLKGRHLQMIAIGGAIGTGLFVSSGATLAEGGPGTVIIAYALIGSMLFCTVQALGELAVLYPVAGSFAVYGTRFVDPAWGFAMGWNYALSWLVTVPAEITAAALTISYWPGARGINPISWVSIFLIIVVTINLFGARGYGEAEFVFGIIKVVAIIGFILLSVVINIGGGPDGSYIGGRYFYDPGAFNNGFKGLCSVLVTASFAFAGTELVGLGSAETINPLKTIPRAIKQVFWRIVLFYIVSLTLIGLNVPSNDPQLLNSGIYTVNTASPFVISIQSAGIEVLPSIFNAAILIAVLSVGNSAIYGSSRTIAALADKGQAPAIFGYIDRAGRPLVAILFASAWGLIAFVATAGPTARMIVLDWLIAISGLSFIFTWGSICFCHIRFRKAWARSGHSLDELAFRSHPGILGSWYGLAVNILVLIAQLWTAIAPTGYSSLSPASRAQTFFEAYLSFPIVAITFVAYKMWRKTSFVRIEDIDLVTGRRELSVGKLIAEARAEEKYWPRWKRIYKLFC